MDGSIMYRNCSIELKWDALRWVVVAFAAGGLWLGSSEVSIYAMAVSEGEYLIDSYLNGELD